MDGEEVVKQRCGRPGRHGVLTLPTRLAGFALAFILAFTDMASLSVAQRCVGGLLGLLRVDEAIFVFYWLTG